MNMRTAYERPRVRFSVVGSQMRPAKYDIALPQIYDYLSIEFLVSPKPQIPSRA